MFYILYIIPWLIDYPSIDQADCIYNMEKKTKIPSSSKKYSNLLVLVLNYQKTIICSQVLL